MSSPKISVNLPNFEDVSTAAQRLNGHHIHTQMINSPILDLICGSEIWFKPEVLQKGGSFKYRGAFNRLSQLSQAEKARGVVAFSSGNHGRGVALVAKELGISVIIVMPEDAPAVKIKAIKALGAQIVLHDRHKESREDIAAAIAQRDNRILVPSYNDPHIIAGQGTIGLEIAQSDLHFDALITCIGGGGLCAGISLAMKHLSPETHIYGAEPQDYNDHQRALATGKREALSAMPPSLCDALMAPIPGEMTWPINANNLSGVVTVSDRDCLMAMALAKKELGLQLEPGGAAAMAAILTQTLPRHYKRIAVILSGGNVDDAIEQRADSLLAM